MHRKVDWDDIATDLDFMNLDFPEYYITRWSSFERYERGVRFICENQNGTTFPVEIEVAAEDLLRVRTARESIQHRDAGELLLPDGLAAAQPAVFSVGEREDCLVITTGRVVATVFRFPWKLTVADRESGREFFSQAVNDLCFGMMFENPPLGFDTYDDGRCSARETIAIRPGEAFYGLGESFTSLNKANREVSVWCADAGGTSGPRSYKAMPFLTSTSGYGLFVNTTFPTLFRMGSDSAASYSFHSADEQLDYFIIYGPQFSHILKRYAQLTGFAPMPPKWSFGHWISRCMYMSQEEVLRVAQGMRERNLPCDVLSIDPYWMGDGPWCSLEWDREAFPDPEGMIAALKELDIRLSLWITPYIASNSAMYREGLERGYFLRDATGEPVHMNEGFGAAGQFLAGIDFTDPGQTAWWQQRLESLLRMGVAVFKTDFAEQCPVGAVAHDGRSGIELHNLYPLLFNKAAFETVKRVYGRGLTWGRSGYIGSQRYPVQWGGDSYASYPGLYGQVRGLLGYGLTGIPFCSHDIGGFDFEPEYFRTLNIDLRNFQAESLRESAPDTVIYCRWMQFGCFSSHARSHGKREHEPWEYGAEAEAIADKYLKLRYTLMPYIYSEAVRSTGTALPMVRPMVLDFQHDRSTWNIDTQYMFGSSFLVAPVLNPEGEAAVYLPEGEWVEYWGKVLEERSGWKDVQVPLATLPLWIRGGAIIPYMPDSDRIGTSRIRDLRLEIYCPGEEGALAVFDEIDNEPQQIADISYRTSEDGLEVTVQGFAGSVEIVVYGGNGPDDRRTGSIRCRADSSASLSFPDAGGE